MKPADTWVAFPRDTPTAHCELQPNRNTHAYSVTVKVIHAMKAYDGPGSDVLALSVFTQRKNINLREGGDGQTFLFRRV